MRHESFIFTFEHIRSEGSIAIVKKFDFDFFMIFDSISLPQPKNVFQKKVCLCVCVCVCVCLCLSLSIYLSPDVAPKPTDKSCSNSIFRVLLQLSPAHPFHFRPILNIKDTLMLRVVHIRNKKRNDKHRILQTWSIDFVAVLLNQHERPPRKYCYPSSEIHYQQK